MTAFARLAEAFATLEGTASRTTMVTTIAGLFGSLERVEIQPSVYLLQGNVAAQFEAPQFGISEKLTSRVLAAWAHVPLEKIEAEYRKVGDHGVIAERLASRLGPPPRRHGLTILDVHAALRRLAAAAGSGSVQAKITALVALLAQASPLEARYLLRLPMGRLRLGVGDATLIDGLARAKGERTLRGAIERAYSLCSDLGLVAKTLFSAGGVRKLNEFDVQVGRPVKMQFAERVASIDDIVARLGRCSVEPKYDGFRCQVHKDGARVRIFSRNQEDNSAMFPDLIAAVNAQVKARRAIFEGEALAYDADTGTFLPFQVTVQRKRVHGIDEAQAAYPLRLNVFDLLYLEGDDLTTEPYRSRRAALATLLRKGERLVVAPALLSDDAAEIATYFDDQLAAGLEGIVAKKLDAPYSAGKRSFNWIKFKRAYRGRLDDTLDLVIVGYFAGRGARAKLGIGAVLCAVYDRDHDRFRTIAKVASGLSDADWIALRKRLQRDRIDRPAARLETTIVAPYWVEPKVVVEVFADEMTRSPVHTAGAGRIPDGTGLALRFPRIVRGVRSDRTAEDATTEAEVVRLYGLQGKPARKRASSG